jgi:hypothetical protein
MFDPVELEEEAADPPGIEEEPWNSKEKRKLTEKYRSICTKR